MTSQIQKHAGTLQYNRESISFCFWSHADAATPVDTVIFLGSAQVGKIPKWAAQAAPAVVVMVDGLPHWKAHPNDSDLAEFAHAYTVAAFKIVLNHFKIPSAHIVGVSQAAPGVIWAARNLAKQVQNVALVAPLGLTANILGTSPEARLRKLKWRTLRTYLQFSHTPFNDLRIFYVQLMLLRSLLLETRWSAAGKKYASGLSQDILEDCRVAAIERHRRGNSFTVFLAEKDKIFPPHEILASLKQAKIDHIDTVIMRGISHPPLETRSDQKAVWQIVTNLREQATAAI